MMKNEIYDLMCNKFGIKSVLDLKIKWTDVYRWLGFFQWISRSFDNVSAYLLQKGYPSLL